MKGTKTKDSTKMCNYTLNNNYFSPTLLHIIEVISSLTNEYIGHGIMSVDENIDYGPAETYMEFEQWMISQFSNILLHTHKH